MPIKTAKETTLQPYLLEKQGIVYQDPFKKIEKIVAQFDGFSKEYYVSNFGLKAALLVIHDNKVLLVRQYRLFAKDLSYEIPGGSVNKNETLEAAAVRECYEETGIKAKRVELLLAYQPDLEYTYNPTSIFLATEIEKESTQSFNHEWIPLKQCFDMLFANRIEDSLSIIALLTYYAKKVTNFSF